MSRWGVFAWPGRYWARQSLRARITLLATALFALAVATGAVLLIVLQRYALVRVLDATAQKTANDIAEQIRKQPDVPNNTVYPTTGGVTAVQVVDASDHVVDASPGADRVTPALRPAELARARAGARLNIIDPFTGDRSRALARPADNLTVVVLTDLSRVDDSVRVLTRAALIGAPIAVLLLGLSTYFVVALTLRSVAALRHGAADVTAAGLDGQRLPVPIAQDEIQRLAITLNAMLDRIERATSRQRTFVGDAAHELRSPLASLQVQLEVAQRMGPDGDWPGLIDDVLIDVGRLDRLVKDLLALARQDETGGPAAHEPVELTELVDSIVAGYNRARVAVTLDPDSDEVTVFGDRDGLHRVVVNLVDNAVRYAQTGVEVRVGRDEAGGTAVARLTVTDDGPGLPESERDRVFDRFYRAETSRSRDLGGTGLGLPIVRDLVRAHNGAVELVGRPDDASGLQAVVTLPLS
ncbi:MAG TPA: HAMP domain-containing sensor histidine kinase [Jatrophihabitantaceae bacterium]|jgi:signal transduction histidine kinase|nr:HAMP domain-containing sensor histidine kinase [Jatrophihabitantaceae bacterium]